MRNSNLNFFLLVIAIILSLIMFPIGWLYSVLTLNVKKSRLSVYVYKIALSIDQLGNVVCSNLFNDFLIKKNGYLFGDEDQTISCVIGVNKYFNTLSSLGVLLSKILNFIDDNHVEKAAFKVIERIKNK